MFIENSTCCTSTGHSNPQKKRLLTSFFLFYRTRNIPTYTTITILFFKLRFIPQTKHQNDRFSLTVGKVALWPAGTRMWVRQAGRSMATSTGSRLSSVSVGRKSSVCAGSVTTPSSCSGQNSRRTCTHNLKTPIRQYNKESTDWLCWRVDLKKIMSNTSLECSKTQNCLRFLNQSKRQLSITRQVFIISFMVDNRCRYRRG